jgi:hypothetical protein
VTGKRLIVVGAGPVGLAAALGALQRSWDVTVLEQEDVGASLRRWGPTTFFSPLSMNVSPPMAELLRRTWLSGDALLTGPEFADQVLAPLTRTAPLAGRIRTAHRVVAIGRLGLTRSDLAGHPTRAERPFRLLVQTPNGEQCCEADAVIDASGTYGQPTALGDGGVPVPGERAVNGRLIRHLGDLHSRLDALAGKTVLLVGHGHSAANAIVTLAHLAAETPGTRIVWATRSLNRRPCVDVASDPLPERHRIVTAANQLAASPPAWLTVERRAAVQAIHDDENGRLTVSLSHGRTAMVDAIVGLTGYRPDLSFLSELPLDVAAPTEGTRRLARALCTVTDCLTSPSIHADDLESGEPGFYMAGSKSYGRARTFLLKTGYDQLDTILAGLGRDAR